MVNLYECHFIYNDINSRNYDLIIANIETERFRPISGDKKGVFLFNRNSKANELMGDDYKDSPLSIDIEIVTCSGRPMDLQTIREVERWLFTNSIYRRLYIDMEDDPYGETYEMIGGIQKRLYFNCRFLKPKKIESRNGVIGFKCVLETDSMMLWQDEITHILNFKKPVIYTEAGEEKTLLLGDFNMDGRLSVDDAENILITYTSIFTSGSTPQDWTELHEIVDPAFDTAPTNYQLMACDIDYTPDDYDNDALPDITVEDAQWVLNQYVCDLVYTPYEKRYITIEDGETIIVVDSNTRCPIIEVDSDIDGYTYPVFTIRTGSTNDNTITIFNKDDSSEITSAGNVRRETEFQHIPSHTEFTIDSRTNYVSGGLYQNMTKKYFPRFVEGLNHFEISGDISLISVTWQNRRFL